MDVAPHGTVTFLFTDVEGSTRLWEQHREAMRQALAEHDAVLRSVIAEHHGYVFSTAGDAFSAAFWTPNDALIAAVLAQQRLTAKTWPEPVVLRVRMGVHTGSADERDGDYFGPAVNRAARLMAVGHGGQVLVSLATEELVREQLPNGVTFVDLGQHALAGLARPERVFRVSSEGLLASFPPLKSGQVRIGNVTAQASSFVGRAEELTRLVPEVTARRLITLIGAGGVGKSRLAVEAGLLVADQFSDGVWMCELAPVADGVAVAHAVAATLSIRAQEGLSVTASVVDGLRGRRLLLILDNCEHVLDASADMVGRVTASCPTVSVLATSREPLGVPGERIWVVPSLDPAVEGVELFCARAAAADAGFSPTETDLTVIAGICEQLDGMPLAIELAAARVRSMTPADLADRLDDRFHLLRGTHRGGPERHRTLRATVQWSYRLLSEAERVLFIRLAVFAGTFDIAAVESVCADRFDDCSEVSELLAGLVDKSMLVVDRAGSHARYRLLETLRQYGEEQLTGSIEWTDLQDRHLRHYVEVARRAQGQFEGATNAEGAVAFRADWANIRVAVRRAITVGDASTASILVEAPFWFACFGLRHELGDWADNVLEMPGATPAANGVAAFFAAARGDHARALELAEAGIASERQPGGTAGWICRWAFSVANWYSGRAATAWANTQALDQAVDPDRDPFFAAVAAAGAARVAAAHEPTATASYLARARTLASPLGNPTLNAYLLWAEAVAARTAHQYDVALAQFRRTLTIAAATESPFLEGLASLGMVLVANLTGSDEPIEAYSAALTRFYTVRDWINMWPAVEGLSIYWLKAGRVEPAAVLLGYLEEVDIRYAPLVVQRQEALIDLASVADAQTWMTRGAVLDRDQLVDYALSQLVGHTNALGRRAPA